MLELAEAAPHEDFVLVSNDGAYAAGKGADAPLHNQLAEEAAALLTDGTVSLIRQLADVDPPGRYRREVVDGRIEAALVREMRDLITEDYVAHGIDPVSLGYPGSDWLEFLSADGLSAVSFKAQELTADRTVEVRFRLTANVSISAPTVQEDEVGQPYLLSGGGIRKLLFTGVGKLATLNRFESIDELTVELAPFEYQPYPDLGDLVVGTAIPGIDWERREAWQALPAERRRIRATRLWPEEVDPQSVDPAKG